MLRVQQENRAPVNKVEIARLRMLDLLLHKYRTDIITEVVEVIMPEAWREIRPGSWLGTVSWEALTRIHS
jgi:hypothetical protein